MRHVSNVAALFQAKTTIDVPLRVTIST